MDWNVLIFHYGLPTALALYFIQSNAKREIRMEQSARDNTQAIRDIAISATTAIAGFTVEVKRLSDKIDSIDKLDKH